MVSTRKSKRSARFVYTCGPASVAGSGVLGAWRDEGFPVLVRSVPPTIATHAYGVRPMNASSLVWTSASWGTSTWWLVAAALAQHLVHRQHALEHLGALVRVERLVLAGGPGEVPAVEEHVAGVDHVDGLPERHCAEVWEVVPRSALTGSSSRACTASVWMRQAPTGSSSTDGPAGSVIPVAPLEEPREPLDEVTDDVPGSPALRRRRVVPRRRGGAVDRRRERTGDAAVFVGRVAHQSSAMRASSLA